MNLDESLVATVICITVICYLIGLVVKVNGKADKWIPAIVGTVGAILGVIGMKTIADFPAKDILNAMAVGIASGLASTGTDQLFKQLKKDE